LHLVPHSLSRKHIRLALRVALAAILAAVLTHTRADPDLFGHVRFGQDMFTAHAVRLVDRYSFASDKPWINHEWLSEIVMSLAYAAIGPTGLVAIKLLLIAAVLVLAIRTLPVPPLTAFRRDLLLAVLVLGTFPQTNHVRPQLFSLALFAWLLRLLMRARADVTALAWCVPLFAVWVNLHGGWLVGGGVFAVWTMASVLARDRVDRHLFARVPGANNAVMIAAGAASLAATLCNPYGSRMWSFLYETVGFTRADIIDWQPVFAVGLAFGLLWTLTGAVAAAGLCMSFRRDQLDPRAAAVVVALGFASLRVGRLLAFFTIATIMLLGSGFGDAAHDRSSVGESRVIRRLAAAIAAAVALAVSLAATSVSAANIVCIRMEGPFFPEPEVAAVIAQEQVRGRMMTWFDWGEYAIWHFAPAVSVSLDGRRETAYSDATIQRQLQFYAAPDQRHAVVATLDPAYIWMPSRLAVTSKLVEDGWVPIFSGSQSTLLAPPGTSTGIRAAPPPSGPSAPRCFPGP
jgi:hypothetical protein